jgi:acetyl esterase/lipase
MSKFRVLFDQAYGADAAQVGDLYLPDSPSPAAVICLLHGGFWRMPYARDQLTPMARDLAGRAYAVWNLEYRRLGAPGGGWPGTLADVAAGIDHLAGFVAEDIALDLKRVVTIGHSAGGHLALWAAGRHHIVGGEPGAQPRVRVHAAVGQAPVADLVRAHELALSGDVAAELLGGTPSQVPERYAAASPRALLPLGVPQLIVHGTADDIVPIEISRGYAAAAREQDDTIEFRELPGVGHFEHIDIAAPAWTVVVDWLKHRDLNA